MNKNNLEETKKLNKQSDTDKGSITNSTATVNSSSTGANLKSSDESTGFTVGSIKELSNEQATAVKGANMSKITSNINYGSLEETKKFNERTAYIKDTD
ncbi:hypothetical protein G9F73_009155 [Clostridium estertheticum]|uniref:hypothetical protein n=1 Tax=Clostridium estertheticum TaxID=238834 RepID=UPI0013EE4243|nr:hypothetical protein [Clostridium estertheticum]MBZ9607971.1 hypothetical protein [Clostridium estertheticum]